MKLATLTAALLLTAAAAHANPTLNGCATKPASNAAGGTGYYNLADPTCVGFRSTQAEDVGLTPSREAEPEGPSEEAPAH
jgi:hypothetical protein